MWIIMIIEDLFRFILPFIYDVSYDCSRLDAVIIWCNAFNADLCHGFHWFTIKCMFSYILTMAGQWYDYSQSIVRLTKISDDENLGLRFTKTHHSYLRPSQDDSMIELRLITIQTRLIQLGPIATGFCTCLKFFRALDGRCWIEKYCATHQELPRLAVWLFQKLSSFITNMPS